MSCPIYRRLNIVDLYSSWVIEYCHVFICFWLVYVWHLPTYCLFGKAHWGSLPILLLFCWVSGASNPPFFQNYIFITLLLLKVMVTHSSLILSFFFGLWVLLISKHSCSYFRTRRFSANLHEETAKCDSNTRQHSTIWGGNIFKEYSYALFFMASRFTLFIWGHGHGNLWSYYKPGGPSQRFKWPGQITFSKQECKAKWIDFNID